MSAAGTISSGNGPFGNSGGKAEETQVFVYGTAVGHEWGGLLSDEALDPDGKDEAWEAVRITCVCNVSEPTEGAACDVENNLLDV